MQAYKNIGRISSALKTLERCELILNEGSSEAHEQLKTNTMQ